MKKKTVENYMKLLNNVLIYHVLSKQEEIIITNSKKKEKNENLKNKTTSVTR